jgi:probable phosphoglycerate mutase
MLIFARHGETIYNLEDRMQGICDSALTPKGISQAEELNNHLKKQYASLSFYISPLGRVRQTYEIACNGIESVYTVLPELTEICYGEWEEQKKEDLKKNPLWEVKMRDRFNFVHPGIYKDKKGESYKQLYQRIETLLNDLLHQANDKNIVIIAHIGVMRCVYKFFNKASDSDAGNKNIPNNEIFLIDKNKDSGYSINSVLL